MKLCAWKTVLFLANSRKKLRDFFVRFHIYLLSKRKHVIQKQSVWNIFEISETSLWKDFSLAVIHTPCSKRDCAHMLLCLLFISHMIYDWLFVGRTSQYTLRNLSGCCIWCLDHNGVLWLTLQHRNQVPQYTLHKNCQWSDCPSLLMTFTCLSDVWLTVRRNSVWVRKTS